MCRALLHKAALLSGKHCGSLHGYFDGYHSTVPLWRHAVACLESCACQEWEQLPTESFAQPSHGPNGQPHWGWWAAGEGVGAAARWVQAVAEAHQSVSIHGSATALLLVG